MAIRVTSSFSAVQAAKQVCGGAAHFIQRSKVCLPFILAGEARVQAQHFNQVRPAGFHFFASGVTDKCGSIGTMCPPHLLLPSAKPQSPISDFFLD